LLGSLGFGFRSLFQQVFHVLHSILTSAVRGLIQDTHVSRLCEGGDFQH